MCNKVFKTLLVLSFMSLVSSCSGTKTSFDYDSNADFTKLKTYQWDNQPSSAFAKANPLIDKRIIDAIEENMTRKGLTQSESADIRVSYFVSFEKKLKTGGLSAGVGMSVGGSGRGHVSLSSGNQVRQTTEGTLIIDMFSTKGNGLIWRATTTKPLKGREATPEESKKRIGQLIYTMYENFPPKQ